MSAVDRHILHRDFETRSTARLDLCGAWRYAADPTTEILCVGYAVDDGPVQIWTPGQPIPEEFIEAERNPNWLVVAHNDQFESAIEERVLQPRYGWPLVPLERHRCTMAMALAAALPGALENAAAALGLPYQKDREGRRLMLRLARLAADEEPDAEDLQRLYEYCRATSKWSARYLIACRRYARGASALDARCPHQRARLSHRPRSRQGGAQIARRNRPRSTVTSPS